jgi:hypothetical protein
MERAGSPETPAPPSDRRWEPPAISWRSASIVSDMGTRPKRVPNEPLPSWEVLSGGGRAVVDDRPALIDDARRYRARVLSRIRRRRRGRILCMNWSLDGRDGCFRFLLGRPRLARCFPQPIDIRSQTGDAAAVVEDLLGLLGERHRDCQHDRASDSHGVPSSRLADDPLTQWPSPWRQGE